MYHVSSCRLFGFRRAQRGAVMSSGQVSFVDFLLTIPVYPDAPRHSRSMKRNAPSEPAGPETSLRISVRYERGDRPARSDSGVICLSARLTDPDHRLVMRKTANFTVCVEDFIAE